MVCSNDRIHESFTHCITSHRLSDNLAEQLYFASSDGRDQEVLELLQRGAPPNNSDYYTREHGGHTSLHMACLHNHLRSAELLIKFGAIVAATDKNGWTPLHYACYFNSEDTAKLLLEHYCPTGKPACMGVSPAVSVLASIPGRTSLREVGLVSTACACANIHPVSGGFG